MASKDSKSNTAGGMGEFYQAYYRHARRRNRTEVAVVLGGVFLALVLVSALIFFWYTEVD